ncbi:helix-turn-helix domain-containing protein [Sorlinia euscelidii]|uniref:helix-turn-helix domain-containing protein n=1 Tax=Sorlinia euscelidii TaxID=3081148 RepID=UPI00374E10EF
MRQIFARRLRAERDARAITQKQICERTGLGQPFISNVERGKITISLDNAGKVAAALGLPLYKLLEPCGHGRGG